MRFGISAMKNQKEILRRFSSRDAAKCIDLSVGADYVAPTQVSEHPASQPVRRQ